LPLPIRGGGSASIADRNARASQTLQAVRRTVPSKRSCARKTISKGTRTRSFEGAAKGSLWTRSTYSVNSGNRQAPSISR